MATTVARWGKSLAVRIPKDTAERAGLSLGSRVDVLAQEHRVVIEKARPRYVLADLIARISDENIHGETDPGEPVGEEIW